MEPWLIATLIGVGVLVVIVLLIAATYNALVGERNKYKNAFAQIDVQLKRRYDLIPNLVEAVKGYMGHERDTLEAVIAARNQAISANSAAAANPGDPEAMDRLNRSESQLTGALGRLIAVSEAYPDLKANQNMLSLQEELTSTENKIAFARQAYNDSVTSYNTRRAVFPTVIFSGMLGFTEAKLLEIESAAQREAPKVSFGK